MSTTYPSNLSDAEWKSLQRYLPPASRRGRPPTHSLRSIFDAIFYVLRTGWPALGNRPVDEDLDYEYVWRQSHTKDKERRAG